MLNILTHNKFVLLTLNRGLILQTAQAVEAHTVVEVGPHIYKMPTAERRKMKARGTKVEIGGHYKQDELRDPNLRGHLPMKYARQSQIMRAVQEQTAKLNPREMLMAGMFMAFLLFMLVAFSIPVGK